MQTTYHNPVMLQQCIEGLAIKPDGIYVDVTFGGGGHSRAILSKLNQGKLLAFDQDEDALKNSLKDPRFILEPQNFRFLKKYLRFHNLIPADGILADLGVSSHQFDSPERGFSIRFDAELDMRMDKESTLTAKEIINTYSEEELQDVFGMYGEVHNAKTLAKTIATARLNNPINTVFELKEKIKHLVKRGKENQYYAQVFQALRIEVNGELDALKEMLEQSKEVLRQGGRLVVISYHSLEDRLVKNFMQKGKFSGEVEKDFYGNEIRPFDTINRKAVQPDKEEIAQNSRARSAKLRVAVKL